MKRILVGLVVFAGAGWAQLATSSLVGTVMDPSGLGVPGASIKAVRIDTGQTREASPDAHGDFVLSSLEAGAYNVTFTAPGFKTKVLSNVVLITGETLPLGKVQLELGSVGDKIEVTAQSETVMTRSSEHASEITSDEIKDLEVRGRNFMDLLELTPGAVSTTKSQDISSNPTIYVSGSRDTANNVVIDGTPSNDMGNGFQMKMQVSQDSVAEVKVLTSNYQAEYGRLAGSNVIAVTKSGTRELHGLVSYYVRNEDFNANNFFNNLNGLPRPRYRYNTITYNVGGPITIPHVFNKNREKLFFFWSQEWWPSTSSTIGTVTVPTALERAGNFSQSLTTAGALETVTNPSTKAPYPNNIVPASTLDPNGVALLNVFPQPNYTNRAVSGGNYNYVFLAPVNETLQTNTAKVDYLLNAKNTITGNANTYTQDETGSINLPDSAGNWPLMIKSYNEQPWSANLRWTTVFNPTLINELSYGYLAEPETDTFQQDQLQKILRTTTGFNAPQFSPTTNDYNVIPNATFGGVPDAATLGIEGRFPQYSRYYIVHGADNITNIRGSHTIKAGIYVERYWRDTKKTGTVFNGAFDFQNNTTNPFNTGYAYSNAALGDFYSYTQSTSRDWVDEQLWDQEVFVQDNWKATRRLTLDYGVRMYWPHPMTERNNLISGFVNSGYNPAQGVKLIAPTMSGGARMGIDPSTGIIYPAALIGAIAPGAGSPSDGMVSATSPGSLSNALTKDRGVEWGPRFGFAYDVFGDGKTAIRGGFGMFYNRPQGGPGYFFSFVGQPPLAYNPTLTYGQISSLSAATSLLSPSSVYAPDVVGKVASVMNYSIAVQRDIGFQTVVDVGYQASLGRHLQWDMDQNGIPIGADFQPANQDPTTGKVLSNNFLRPYAGYGAIYTTSFGSSSNYNSMQVTAKRRFSKNLQFGAAWTWSKAMDFNDTDSTTVESIVNPKTYYYGKAGFDRTHNVAISYIYDLPRSPWRNAAVSRVLDGWELSGITIFQSGAPLGVSLTTTNGEDITGTASLAPRVNLIANPVLAKSNRTFGMNFNTAAIALPAVGTLGDAAPNFFRGPGINNFDMALIKNVTVYERLHFQLRVSAFNIFNHTQFTTENTAAQFNPTTGQQINNKLGAFTAAADPRQLQLGLKLVF